MKKVLIAVLLVAAGVGGWLTWRSIETQAPSLPDGRLTLTLPDLEGQPRSLADWNGKARLVNFWATWCAPCRKEIPLLKRVQAEHGATLQVIGVAVDHREDVVAYAQAAEFNYPVLIGLDDAIAAAEAAGIPFQGVPFTVVVTPDGQLVKTHLGEIHEDQLRKIVEVLARLDSGDLDLAGARAALGRI